MKILFIPAKHKQTLNKEIVKEFSKLPKEIAITYSIQYRDIAEEIKLFLSKSHNISNFTQVLGCSKPIFNKTKPKVTLLIGDGKFHALSLAYETKLPVYLFNNHKIERISEKEIKFLETKKKASYVNFLNSKNIGILISTKPGQQNLERALKLRNKLKGKTPHLFISNEINSSEFENFPQIQSWVNTACPRIDMTSQVINIKEI